MTNQPITVVVTDANVLINFFHIGRLMLLGDLAPYRFMVPAEVVNEIAEPAQKADMAAALTRGVIAEVTIDSLEALALFGTLRDIMGRGEAACLALAKTEGWWIASDEKRRFRRTATDLIGKDRIIGTETLLRHAITIGQVSIDEADAYKAVLETKRFAMPFASFRDLA